MRLLLDSQALLWALHDPRRLHAKARSIITDPRSTVYFSAASAWELEIKASRGKLVLPESWLEAALDTGFIELPVTAVDARESARLEWHHADPFDRMLVAQAQLHGLTFITKDPQIRPYGVKTLAA